MKKNPLRLLKKISKGDFIEVTWRDHFSEAGWKTKEAEPLYCRSVGAYWGTDEYYVITCGSVDPFGFPGNMSYKMKNCITEIKRLYVKKSNKKTKSSI